MIWFLNSEMCNLFAILEYINIFISSECTGIHFNFNKFWNNINLLTVKEMIVFSERSKTISSKVYVSRTHKWINSALNFYVFNVIKFSQPRSCKFWFVCSCSSCGCRNKFSSFSFISTTTLSVSLISNFSINILMN